MVVEEAKVAVSTIEVAATYVQEDVASADKGSIAEHTGIVLTLDVNVIPRQTAILSLQNLPTCKVEVPGVAPEGVGRTSIIKLK